MKKIETYFLNILIIVIILSSCEKKDGIIESNVEEQLIGRWEAIEYSWIDSNGNQQYLTFGENGDFKSEYSIGIDYSSGFELMEKNRLDLIWESKNKEQFYTWKLIDKQIIIDEGTLDFTIISVNESELNLIFNNGKNTYKMIKLE